MASPPQVATLAQSSSKEKFFERLKMDPNSPRDMELYRMMKEEASAGRQRLSENRANLTSHTMNDPTIHPPYTWDNLQETARHRTILEIYRHARPETRTVYDLGHYTQGPNEENWIIKWMLWHVFRYRDNRNRDSRLRNQSIGSSDQDLSGDNVSGNEGLEVASQVVSESSRSNFFDPIRDARSRETS